MNLNRLADIYLDERAKQNLRRSLPTHAGQSGRVDLSSNDYLGLSQNPEVIESGIQYAQKYGAGATGSRLLSGNLPCFEELEAKIAEFKRAPAALFLSTGYQTNSAVLSALLSPPLMPQTPVVFADKLIHSSMHHACQRAGIVQNRFSHNDLDHLASLLEKEKDNPAPKWIISETVFGMDGDLCPMIELAELAMQYGASVYLDEAHATGLIGPQGRGLGAFENDTIAHLKSEGRWVIMGTFSKAVGVSGAYVCCSQSIKNFLINRCTGFVYSTAPSPFVAGAVLKSLELIPGLHTQRENLLEMSQQFRDKLQQHGLDTGLSTTHIVPVIVRESGLAIDLKNALGRNGFEVSAVRPPTVPRQTARIRMALNSTISIQDLNRLSASIIQWKTEQAK